MQRNGAALVAASLCLMLLTSGCAGGGGVVQHPGDRFPDEQYLVATATSSESIEDAETRARAALAAQIRSQIRSVLDDRTEQVSRNDDIVVETSTSSSIRQETSFDHMELFHADPQSRRQVGDRFHAAVYLERAEAHRVLRDDFEVAGERLRREATSLSAVPDHDLPGFAARFGEARAAWQTVRARALELRAVMGAFPAGYVGLRDHWLDAEAERHRRVDGLELALAVKPCVPAGDPLDSAALREELVQALDEMGLVVRGRACGDSGYLLSFQPRLRHRGMAGVVTSLTLVGELRDCRTGDRWEFTLEDEAWKAEAPRADSATRKLQATVTDASLRPLLADALLGRLPLR